MNDLKPTPPSARLSILEWFCVAAPLPALVLGVMVMRQSGVPATIWGQNLSAGLVLMIFCLGVLRVRPVPAKQLRWAVTGAAILSAGLLLGTLADDGLSGVHRWVVVGPLRLHAGAVCLPVLIMALGEALACTQRRSAVWLAPFSGLAVMGVLCVQPDAAQATAFGGAMIVLLFWYHQKPAITRTAALAIVVCAAWSWLRPDPLLPVRHVEGIVGLASQSGVLWLLASLTALALLPLPFFLVRDRAGRPLPQSLALGLYFAFTLIAPSLGAFPVPLMGYGLSPIVGYFAALTWLLASATAQAKAQPY